MVEAKDGENVVVGSIELRKKDWAGLLNDEERGGWLVPIFALAHENSLDAVMRPYKEPVSAAMREKLIVGAAAGVRGIYRHFQTQRSAEHQSLCNINTLRRRTPKIGRHEPCPCGSG